MGEYEGGPVPRVIGARRADIGIREDYLQSPQVMAHLSRMLLYWASPQNGLKILQCSVSENRVFISEGGGVLTVDIGASGGGHGDAGQNGEEKDQDLKKRRMREDGG